MLVQIVLEDGGGGQRVELAALAQALQIAALGSGDIFRSPSGEALVPHFHGQADHALGDAREVSRAARLRAFGTVSIQRQANNHVGHVFPTRDRGHRVQDWCETTAASIQHQQWRGQETSLVAERNADAPLTRVDAQDATRWITWVLER